MRLVAGALCLVLVGCVAPGEEGAPSQAPDPLPAFDAPLPDVSGEWLVTPTGGGYGEVWTLKQVGNTVSGTIAPDADTLPQGVSIAERPALGHFEEGTGGWTAVMDVPSGVLVPRGNTGFSFCPRPGGADDCRTGLKRALPSPSLPPH